MNAPVVLGLDPGFAALGIALVRLLPDGEEVLALKVVRTEKSNKKTNVLAASDNFRRTREIARELELVIKGHPVRLMAAEYMSFPRNASTAAKMALCWGVIGTLSELSGIGCEQCSPQRLKQVVAGNKQATKEDVQMALAKRYGNHIMDLYEGPAGLLEHPMDALGAVVTCLDSETFRLARQMAGAA